MLSDTKKLLDEALNLSEDDRRHVARMLLDSIPDSDTSQIEEAWNNEVISRANATLNSQITGLDGEPAVNELEQKLRRIHH